MKKVILVLLFALSTACYAQWGTLSPDLLVSMNTSTPGTTLTGTIANAGTVSSKCTVGTNCSFTTVGMCSTCFTVGAFPDTCSNLGAVQMTNGGSLFGAHTLNYNNMAHDDSQDLTNTYESFSGSLNSITTMGVLYCITLGPPLQTSSGSDYDILGIWDTGGDYWETQLNNNCNGSNPNVNYGIRLETKPTAHSTCIPLAAKGTYWVEVIANTSTGFAEMYVWTAGGQLMGSTSITAGDFGTAVRYIQIGNNENGSSAGTTTYFQNIMAFWSSASCVSGTCPSIFWPNNSLAAGVLSPARFSNWTPGVVGDIPTTRTQCVNTQCAVVTSAGTSVTSAQINSALANAPANTYVLLPTGHLTSATAGITFGGVSNVTLRGAGANQTFLAPTSEVCNFFSVCLGTSTNYGGSPQNGPVAVTGDTTQGSTTITLASVANLVVGNPVILDQLDPTADNGGVFQVGTNSSYTPTGTSPGLNGAYSTQGGNNGVRTSGCAVSSPTNCYHQQQIVTVASCNGVTTVGTACTGTNVAVGIYPGIHAPNWSTANMFAWWATSPSLSLGLEDLNVDSSGNSGAIGIGLNNCQGCWVKGVTSYDTSEAHIQFRYANQATVRNNYFFLTQNAATSSYGVECFSGSDALVENNIFHTVTTPMIDNGPCSGNVWAYNYTANELYTGSSQYSIPAIGIHSGGVDSNLFEGNVTDGATGDNIHGTNSFTTFFRNVLAVQPACWSSGSFPSITYAACNNNYTPFQDFSFHRFYSLIGNVLGNSGIQSDYCNGGSSCGAAFTQTNANVLMVGGGNTIANDSNVVTTFMAWGNADPVTGFSSPRFNCSDVSVFPTSGALNSTIFGVQLPYLNSCPSSHTLPASFYRSTAPSWWTSGLAYPPIGPDVSNGTIKTTSGTAYSFGPTLATNMSQVGGATLSTYANGQANMIPAGLCYLSTLSGTADGTGTTELSFNEATCYGNGSVIGFTGVVKITGTVTVN